MKNFKTVGIKLVTLKVFIFCDICRHFSFYDSKHCLTASTDPVCEKDSVLFQQRRETSHQSPNTTRKSKKNMEEICSTKKKLFGNQVHEADLLDKYILSKHRVLAVFRHVLGTK